MPAPLDPKIVDRVKGFWAKESHPPDGKRPSRRHLYYKVYIHRYGREPSWGKFNDIVNEAERKAPEPFPLALWQPWTNEQETAEETAFLLRLNAIDQAQFGHNLFEHAAKWARRLRAALDGLHPYGQYQVVSLYEKREVVAHYLMENLYTADLDTLVAYKPWLPENQRAYILAVESEIVPYPILDVAEPARPILYRAAVDALKQTPERKYPFSGFLGFDSIPRLWQLQLRTIIGQHISLNLDLFGEELRDSLAQKLQRNNPEKVKTVNQLLDFWSGQPVESQVTANEGEAQ